MRQSSVVYLAGPAYSPEETAGQETIATMLEESGFGVYLPSRDGIEPNISALARVDDPGEHARHDRAILESAVFALEIYQVVNRCDCLVFNMNGRVPDEAGAFAAAVAFTVGEPVVLYKLDHRSKLHGNDNAMILGLSYDFSRVTRPGEIPGELEKAIGKSRRFEGAPARGGIPFFVRITAELGHEVWKALLRFKISSPAGDVTVFLDELSSILAASDASGFREPGPRPTRERKI